MNLSRLGVDLTGARPPQIGFSPETMWLCPQGWQGMPCVVKYSRRIAVYEEGEIYRWLKGKLPVPEVYYNGRLDDDYVLIVSMEKGMMLNEAMPLFEKAELIRYYAEILRMIHAIDIKDFPFDHGRAWKMKQAEMTVLHGSAKCEYFERELINCSPEDIYKRAVLNQDFTEDLVFTHGDVCFPNFLVDKNKQLTAVLDVSGAGINDRYLDLAIGLRTLRYNFDAFTSDDVAYFLDCYGASYDEKRLSFYIYLDELTNG